MKLLNYCNKIKRANPFVTVWFVNKNKSEKELFAAYNEMVKSTRMEF